MLYKNQDKAVLKAVDHTYERSPPAACWRDCVLLKVSFGISRTRLSWEVFRNYRLHHHNNSLFKKAIIGIIIWDKIHKKMKTCHHHHQSCRRKLLSSEVKVSKEKPRLIIWFPGSFPISRLFGYKARNMMRDMGGVGFVAIQLSETETLGIFPFIFFLSPSGDLGIGLVWHNLSLDPTGPHFGLTVEILFKLN